jgi:hypothetical protein
MQPDHPDESTTDRPGEPGVSTGASVLLGLLILAGLAALAVWGLLSLAPDEAPAKRDPNVIDSIFSNVVVIAAARVLLLATAGVLLVAGVYIVVSTIVRMARGQWLRRAGPFESDLAHQEQRLEETEDFLEEWLAASEQNEELLERLEERDLLITQLAAERDQLMEALDQGGRS